MNIHTLALDKERTVAEMKYMLLLKSQERLPNPQMWRAIRCVLNVQINKQRKVKVRKDHPGSQLIVL